MKLKINKHILLGYNQNNFLICEIKFQKKIFKTILKTLTVSNFQNDDPGAD